MVTEVRYISKSVVTISFACLKILIYLFSYLSIFKKYYWGVVKTKHSRIEEDNAREKNQTQNRY